MVVEVIQLRLYHSPGSCSEGIRFLLDVVGAKYDLEIVDLKKGAHKSPEYLSLNPKGKVPALQIAESKLLTEFPVIAYWIARKFPEEELLPDDLYEQVKVMALTEYIVSGLHMRGSVFAMVPQKFTSNIDAQEDLREYGRSIVEAGLDLIEGHLGDGPFLFEKLSIADAAAFYLFRWERRIGVDLTPDLRCYLESLERRYSSG